VEVESTYLHVCLHVYDRVLHTAELFLSFGKKSR